MSATNPDPELRGMYDRDLLRALKDCAVRLERLEKLGLAKSGDCDALRQANLTLDRAHDMMPDAAPWVLGHRRPGDETTG